MSKPYDATTKQLVEAEPQAWLRYLGLTGEAVSVVEADLATVTAEADRVLRVDGPTSYIAHLEFQASYDRTMAERMLRYNVLLRYRHGLPVQSVVVLLRGEADGLALTGILRDDTPHPDGFIHFGYRVVRVWQTPVENLLSGGLATLPLAPLASVSADALPPIVRRMEERIRQESPTPAEAGMLWTVAYVLMGLKYPSPVIDQILKGVRDMEESVTYQAIIAKGEARGKAEGKAEEARNLILRLGSKRFGAASVSVVQAIAATDSVEQLEQLAERLLEVETWEELLA